MNLDNHYSSATLALIGLTPNATSDEIDAAAEREMADLDDNYGDDNDCSLEEMRAYLAAWVEREQPGPIEAPGFTVDPADGRAWTANGQWGLVREDDGTLSLLDSEGYPATGKLSDDDAAYVLRRGAGDDLAARWEHYANTL